ncbi:MAG: hypothetical protein IME99_09125 [Proteobacteria bacterium]|nr:hypothetical protein [Pseudomonadota bacterium]
METIIASLLLCIGISFLLISKNQLLLCKTVNVEGVVNTTKQIKTIRVGGYLLSAGSALLLLYSTLL